MTKVNGVVFYRGPSLLNGAPIVGVAVGLASASANRKTGGMVQTYILPAGMEPHMAARTGADVSVCGGCPHRPKLARVTGVDPCYVNLGQGPLVVYRALVRGKYPDVDPVQFGKLCTGRMLRLGSWGEPVAIPRDVWAPAVAAAAGHTGYTHRWRTRGALQWRGTLMASCDSIEDLQDARDAGWGTFRVALPGDTPVAEMPCPAAKENGARTTCSECRACNGSAGTNVVSLSHGPRHRGRKVVA